MAPRWGRQWTCRCWQGTRCTPIGSCSSTLSAASKCSLKRPLRRTWKRHSPRSAVGEAYDASSPGDQIMSVIQEFKKFALRGNVVDMAVGIIIGAAFGTVVKSLVDDILIPPIGILTNR